MRRVAWFRPVIIKILQKYIFGFAFWNQILPVRLSDSFLITHCNCANLFERVAITTLSPSRAMIASFRFLFERRRAFRYRKRLVHW